MNLQSVLTAAISLSGFYQNAKASNLNITISQPGVPFAPRPLPKADFDTDRDQIIFDQISQLTRDTKWKLADKIPFEGDTFEPEGLVRIGNDRYIVSAAEYTKRTEKYPDGIIINGTDRTAGEGFAHMIVFDGKGKRIADATVSKAGSDEYHNGGIDYDGEYIWATLSQYRPNSTATVVKMDPYTLEPETVLHVADHMGGAVHDPLTRSLVTLSWGARNASLWSLPAASQAKQSAGFDRPERIVKNPSHYVDYQDCKMLSRAGRVHNAPVMICSGITAIYNTTIGGIAVVDMTTMQPVYEVPLTMVSDAGNLVTKNPFDVGIVDGKLRLYFLPDERNSTLYVYEVV